MPKTIEVLINSRFRRWRNLLWPLVILLCFGLAALNFIEYRQQRDDAYHAILTKAEGQAISEVVELERLIQLVQRSADEVATAISERRLGSEDYDRALVDMLQSDQLFYGAAIAFTPYSYENNRRLYAPYFVKKDQGLERIQIEERYDYTSAEYEWYERAIAKGSRWSRPYFDENLGEILMTTYSAVAYWPDQAGHPQPAAVITIDLAIDDLGDVIEALDYGEGGYAELVTNQGRYLYSPEKDRVLGQRSILDGERWAPGQDLAPLRELLMSPETGVVEIPGRDPGKMFWVTATPVAAMGWHLINNFEAQEVAPKTAGMRHSRMLTLACIVTGLCVLLIYRQVVSPVDAIISWTTSLLVTVILAGGISEVWNINRNYDSSLQRTVEEINTLRKATAARGYLRRKSLEMHTEAPQFIPTGAYIDSLKMTSPDEVRLIGSLWQKFDLIEHRDIPRGVIFPGAANVTLGEPFVVRSENVEIVRWQFQADLLYAQDNSRFPLIKDILSLGIFPRNIGDNVILEPDLDSYTYLAAGSLPGLNPDVFLPGWRLERSYYEMRKWSQPTTFGLDDSFAVRNTPELYFNIEIEKVYMHAFITFLTPLIIAFFMVFITLLLTTRDTKRLELMRTGIGFDIGISASIFFVVVLSHISLRQRIVSSEVFYLEYFYLLMYFNMLWVCFHSILNGLNPALLQRLTFGVAAKKVYFPANFTTIFVFTWLKFLA